MFTFLNKLANNLFLFALGLVVVDILISPTGIQEAFYYIARHYNISATAALITPFIFGSLSLLRTVTQLQSRVIEAETVLWQGVGLIVFSQILTLLSVFAAGLTYLFDENVSILAFMAIYMIAGSIFLIGLSHLVAAKVDWPRIAKSTRWSMLQGIKLLVALLLGGAGGAGIVMVFTSVASSNSTIQIIQIAFITFSLGLIAKGFFFVDNFFINQAITHSSHRHRRS